MKKSIRLICAVIFISKCVSAQVHFSRDTSVLVSENGTQLNQAWVGGVNAMQPSKIDLNIDGINDLIFFDRSGNKISPFLSINNEYVFAPEYRLAFPKLHDWVLLEDYNCDGKQDIFAYSSGGLEVYKNTSTTSLSFSKVTSLLLSNYGPNNFNMFVSSVDIPAISDIDDDGDLDILTFAITGGFVEFHKNLAIENYGNCDTLAFQFTESCWGNFFEGLNSYLVNCTFCTPDSCSPAILPNNSNSKQKHSGSTLLALDIDDDNDKDLVLGDVSFTNMNLLTNGGDNQNANMITVDSLFPKNNNNTLPTDLHLFPAPFYLDVTHDGIKDLIVTTNSQANSENFESVWLFSNSGTNTLPDFNFVSKAFIQDEMIDLGEGAYPSFFDYNNDGLQDLVVGNYGYHDINGNDISGLALFENTGTLSQPSFDLISRDFTNISTMNLNVTLNIPAMNIYPAFGDLDGDNDKDMILGDAEGKLHLFTNDGSIPTNFTLNTVNYENIDVGYFATPQLVDVNRDGLLDLLVGDMTGTITYFPNKGTINLAVFDSTISNFGGIDVDASYISTGYSAPFLIDINGEYHLYIGSNYGGIYHYNHIDGNLSGNFNLISSTEQNIEEGARTALAIKDLNNDLIPDIMLGNYCGGLSFFVGDTLTATDINDHYATPLLVYPNPANKNLFVQSKLTGNIKLYSVLGKLLLSEEKTTQNHNLDIGKLPNGIYIIRLGNSNNKFVKE